MNEFPKFMMHPTNRVAESSKHTQGIEGYVYNGANDSQIVVWVCPETAVSTTHTHDFDEYILVVAGQYDVILGEKTERLVAGDEFLVPKGVTHSGRVHSGARVINAFGGCRCKRVR